MEGILDLLNSGLGLVPKQRVHAHDDAGGAEATLGAVAFGDPLLKGADDVDTCVAEPLPGSLVTQLDPAHVNRQCRVADGMKSNHSAATSQL